jgi:hypothetical protein
MRSLWCVARTCVLPHKALVQRRPRCTSTTTTRPAPPPRRSRPRRRATSRPPFQASRPRSAPESGQTARRRRQATCSTAPSSRSSCSRWRRPRSRRARRRTSWSASRRAPCACLVIAVVALDVSASHRSVTDMHSSALAFQACLQRDRVASADHPAPERSLPSSLGDAQAGAHALEMMHAQEALSDRRL